MSTTPYPGGVSAHPDRAAIDARLLAGETGAALRRDFPELTAKQLNDRARKVRRRAGASAAKTTEVHVAGDDIDGQLAEARDLIERAQAAGLHVATARIERGGSEWDAQVKGGGLTELESKRRKAVVTVRADEPAGPALEIRQAQPVEVHYHGPRRKPTDPDDRGRWALIVPDGQRPFIDHRVVDLQYQVLEDLQAQHGVSRIVHLGDDLDLPDFGKHRSAPSVMGRVQEAIDGQYQELATERAIAPDAEIDWIEGNHDARLINWCVDNAQRLIGIRRAREKTEPVISIPFLLRLDELGVTYHDPYPEGELWLNSHLRCVHGDIVKGSKGATAAAYLAQGQMSTIYGHIHRHEIVYQTRHTKQGPRSYFAGSPGCRCRLDGVVPSAKTGVTRKGAAGRRRTEDWQHGLWVVRYETTGQQLYHVEPITIWGGVAQWRGKTYRARCDIDGNPAD